MNAIHGGNPHPLMNRFGISERPKLDFSVNISPLGLPQPIAEAWPRLLECISTYPSEDGFGVTRYYGARFGLPADAVLPGNGAADLIFLALRSFPIKSVALLSPTFHEYERALTCRDLAIHAIRLDEQRGFAAPDISALASILEQVDALVLCNPNNPTGTDFTAETILSLAEAYYPKQIFVDEAFIQFRDDWRLWTLQRPERLRRNILVFHSLTKLYALPGLRIGAIIGHPETICSLKQCAAPWRVNSLAEHIAPMLIDCVEYETALRNLVDAERKHIFDRLCESNAIRLFKTPANFFLAEWIGDRDLDELLRFLLKDGLFIRDCRNFEGLERDFFRFAIRRPDENRRLSSALLRFEDV